MMLTIAVIVSATTDTKIPRLINATTLRPNSTVSYTRAGAAISPGPPGCEEDECASPGNLLLSPQPPLGHHYLDPIRSEGTRKWDVRPIHTPGRCPGYQQDVLPMYGRLSGE